MRTFRNIMATPVESKSEHDDSEHQQCKGASLGSFPVAPEKHLAREFSTFST